MKGALLLFAAGAGLHAQGPLTLPAVNVHSPRVANQGPALTFAMPVSALRYEPGVDVQARHLAEGQADVTLRGGIFENTGFRVGALTLWDPQTGHYGAEIPVAPALFGAPDILTGAELAGLTNATSGAIAYGWRPVRTAGALAAGVGSDRLRRGDVYQGGATVPAASGRTFGADVALAYSESGGAVPFGEHEFSRFNGRLQLAGGSAQTDLVAAYQEKFFGWPNLYTPFNSAETENLQTVLFALNHRIEGGAGGFFEAGAYYRRNKDDYAFNRFAPLGPVHPFQHTTWTTGIAAGGRARFAAMALNYRAEVLADELQSTSLTFGRYRTRTLAKAALVPEVTWRAGAADMTLKAGAAFDDSNRDDAAWSPVIELAREQASSLARRIHVSYTEATQLPTYTALNASATAGLFRGNPNLGRQRSRNLEAGVQGSLGGWTGEAAVFWRRDDALVDWTFRRGVTARTANAVDVDVVGFETFARRSWKAADVVLGYTILGKDGDYRGAPVDASFYALNYARHRVTLAFTARLGGGFTLRMDNAVRWQADNPLRTRGGDEAVNSSLSLAWRLPTWERAELAVQVDNLWDSDFQEVPAVPASPRQFSFGVTTTW